MPPLADRATVRGLLNADRPWAVYALGDLAPEHWPHAVWLRPAGAAPALAMLYRGFRPPVVFALGDVAGVLDEIAVEPELLLHVRRPALDLLRQRYRIVEAMAMWRMVLDPAAFTPPAQPCARLGAADVPALERLYADGNAAGEAPHFFLPSMVAQGVFMGVREGDDLVAAAGTHLVVPAEGVAAVGNVYTRRDRRGRGLGARTTAAVAAELVRQGIPTIALNVAQANAGAGRVYERLGFRRYCEFFEGRAVRAAGQEAAI